MARTGRPRRFEDEDVINGAREIFWRNGYAGTSMQTLKETLGICRAASTRRTAPSTHSSSASWTATSRCNSGTPLSCSPNPQSFPPCARLSPPFSALRWRHREGVVSWATPPQRRSPAIMWPRSALPGPLRSKSGPFVWHSLPHRRRVRSATTSTRAGKPSS